MISCYPGDHKQNQFRVAICVEIISIHALDALVAQLDRVPGYEPGGQRFESSRARHFLLNKQVFIIISMLDMYVVVLLQLSKNLVCINQVWANLFNPDAFE